MTKKSQRLSTFYPEDNEGKTKDANKKLKSQVKNLKKTIKKLESQVRTLDRSFNKSCDFIQHKLVKKGLPEVLNMIDGYEYKETEIGRKKVKEEKKKEEFAEYFEKCPQCSNDTNKGFNVMKFKGFDVETCPCGYRKRIDHGNDRIKRS